MNTKTKLKREKTLRWHWGLMAVCLLLLGGCRPQEDEDPEMLTLTPNEIHLTCQGDQQIVVVKTNLEDYQLGDLPA